MRLVKRLKVPYLLVSLTFFSYCASSQENPKVRSRFDSIFLHIATHVSATAHDSALNWGRLLLESAEGSREKLKGYMLLATLNEQNGEAATALSYAKRAQRIALEEDNTQWLLRIYGFLSTMYRELGLFDYGKNYLEKASHIAQTIEVPLLYSFILQESSFYRIEEKQYDWALRDLRESLRLSQADSAAKPDGLFSAANERLIGVCYLHLEAFDSARYYYKAALTRLNNIETALKGYLYLGLAQVAIKTDALAEAFPNLEKTAAYAANSKNFKLQLQLLNAYIDYYSKMGEQERSFSYLQEYLVLKRKETESIKRVMRQLLRDSRVDREQTGTPPALLLWGAALMGVGLYFVFRYRKRRGYARQLPAIAGIEDSSVSSEAGLLVQLPDTATGTSQQRLYPLREPQMESRPDAEALDQNAEKPQAVLSPAMPVSREEPVGPAKPGRAMPKAGKSVVKPADSKVCSSIPTKKRDKNLNIPTENLERLRTKLEGFERDKLFLKSDISLSSLAAHLQTNVKYLSFIINRYHGVDFNRYINGLRVEYIVQKLTQDPAYLNYKIAFLASECGFSSHSKFAAIFKELKGIPPSEFIRQHKKT